MYTNESINPTHMHSSTKKKQIPGVTHQKFKRKSSSEGKDVSDEVVGTVGEIWQSEFGYDWKAQLREGCPWWATRGL